MARGAYYWVWGGWMLGEWMTGELHEREYISGLEVTLQVRG